MRHNWRPPKADSWIRAQNCIAQGALTNSKRPSTFIKGVFPTHLKSGKGCQVIDVEGRVFLDMICGLGSSTLGYANDEVNSAVIAQLRRGATLSLATDLELQLAEKIKEYFPFITHMKILKSGTEACMAAIKIARAFTKKPWICSEGYHGWSDSFVSLTPPAHGVHTNQGVYPLNEQNPDSVAANIVEPVITELSDKRKEELVALRLRNGLLIYDEIITGCRFPKFSVAQYWKIYPDIICLGKGLANGLPISIVAGKEDVMNCDYFVSSTFAGETLSMAAALKTLDLLKNKYPIDLTWEKGEYFKKEFNKIWSEIQLEGYPTRGKVVGDELARALFWQESCKSGILWGPSYFFNHCHIDQIYTLLNTSSDIMTRIKTGLVRLEGEMPKQPFAAKIRG